MEFYQRLRQLRNEHKYTQDYVAKSLHYGYTAIANYESGRNEPSIKNLITLADFFDVTVDYLIGATDIRVKTNKLFSNQSNLFLDIYLASNKETQRALNNILLEITSIIKNKQG